MPLQVQGSDKTRLEVHGSVRAQLRVKNSYKITQKVHSSALQVQSSDKTSTVRG